MENIKRIGRDKFLVTDKKQKYIINSSDMAFINSLK